MRTDSLLDSLFEEEASWEAEEENLWEAEWGLESDGETDNETEAFFGQLATLPSAPAALKQIAQAAARAALKPPVTGSGAVDPAIAQAMSLLTTSGARETESLWEVDPTLRAYEMGGLFEDEVNPQRQAYPDALMEHLGHAALEAEAEGEPFLPFLAPLVPLAMKALPMLVKAAAPRVVPQLVRGVGNVAKTLLRSKATKPLVRAVPRIVQQTTRQLAQRAAKGRPITALAAQRALAQQTARVLSNPRLCSHIYRRSRALDRRYHQAPSPSWGAARAGGARATGAGRAGSCPTCGRR